MSETPTQKATPLASTVERVRFYEDRAEVIRRAEIQLKAGDQWVVLPEVTAVLDDRSLQADVMAEGARITAVRVLRRLDAPGEQVDAEVLEKKIEALEDRISQIKQDHRRARTEMKRLHLVLSEWTAGICRIPELADEEVYRRWLDGYQALESQDAQATQALQNSSVAQEDLSETVDALVASLSGKRTEKPRLDAAIEVQLQAEHPTSGRLEVRYRTPCALWRPEHQAILTTEEERSVVDFTTSATVWQNTGEQWEDVEVEFSTARPAQAATAPLLEDDRIRSQRKSDDDTVVVESREQAIQVAGVAGAQTVDEMPGVDDGGEPIQYRAPERVTISSTGRPFRVEIEHLQLNAQTERVVMPTEANVAHWCAAATLKNGGPILAGPIRISRNGNAIGRSKIDFVAKGSPFYLGFGPDDAVRVRRKQTEKRDRTRLTGTQRVVRTIRLYLSNLSGEIKELTVKERIPVSEIEEVEVLFPEQKTPWVLDEKDGFLSRKVLLGAREAKELSYTYEIRAKSNVALPF